MPDTTSLIARVLKRAAEIGVADELPRLSGLAGARLEQIRRGAPLTATEYEQLCRAVAVDPVSMYRAEDRNPQRVPARFRMATSVECPHPTDVRTLALAAELGRILGSLLVLMGRTIKLEQFRLVRAVEGKKDTWKEGYSLGEQARKRLCPKPGALGEMEGLLRDLDVHVARVAFSSRDVDAACVWEPGAVPVVLLNAKGRSARQKGPERAMLAHELCHLLHDAGAQNITTRVSWGTEGLGNYAEAVEVRARAFAPAFLAPRAEVRKWASGQKPAVRGKDVALVKELAEAWGLSFEGAAWHAKNCELIPAERADKLAHKSGKPAPSLEGFETLQAGVPPSMFDESLPRHAAPLWEGWASEIVVAAAEEGSISLARARELLSWS